MLCSYVTSQWKCMKAYFQTANVPLKVDGIKSQGAYSSSFMGQWTTLAISLDEKFTCQNSV